MDKNFLQNLVKEYRKKPYLTATENKELEAYLKKYKIKKTQAGFLIGIEYQSWNRNESKNTLPRILLDFFKFAEAAERLAKIEEISKGEK